MQSLNGHLSTEEIFDSLPVIKISLHLKISLKSNFSMFFHNGSQIFSTAKSVFNSCIRKLCVVCLPPKEPTVTILDACTKFGRILSLLLKQNPLIGELRLYDKCSGVGALAEDLSHIDTRTQLKSFEGKSVLKYAVSVSFQINF